MNHNGFVLPLSLIIVALAGALLIHISMVTSKTVQRTENSNSILRLEVELKNKLLKSILNLNQMNEAVTCKTDNAAVGKSSLQGKVCLGTSYSHMIFNFDELTKAHCLSSTLSKFNQTTMLGLSLSNGSIYSKHTCLEVSFLTNNEILNENLDLSTLEPTSAVIIVTGYFALNQELQISKDTILLTGGDVIINKIISNDGMAHRIDIYSQSGNVIVNETSSEIGIYCSAKKCAIPLDAKRPDPFQDPAFSITNSVLGFSY